MTPSDFTLRYIPKGNENRDSRHFHADIHSSIIQRGQPGAILFTKSKRRNIQVLKN